MILYYKHLTIFHMQNWDRTTNFFLKYSHLQQLAYKKKFFIQMKLYNFKYYNFTSQIIFLVV